MSKPLIVNLYGGPGAGKSTTAAGLFTNLKHKNINCELVTEYAKDLTYEGRHSTLENQIYVFAKQYHRLHRLMKHDIDVIITDSPILLSLVYSDKHLPGAHQLDALIHTVHESMDTLNYQIIRTKPYKSYGRNQTSSEAVALDDVVSKLNLTFDKEITGDAAGLKDLTEHVLSKYYSILKGRCAI